jgi:alginate O-acetyltransferase complex protein AlgI
MLFTQPVFFVFFVLVFALAWAEQSNTRRKLWLLIASYVFYGAWDWRFLSLIAFSTLVNYVAGQAVLPSSRPALRHRWLVTSLVANLSILGVFKYFGFFVDSAVGLLGTMGVAVPRPDLAIVLPVGISFYTFQSMSYTIDIYRGRMQPNSSLLDFSLFVAFFPQLVAGPIVRARTFLPQLRRRPHIADVDFRGAATLFLRGFIKKACIADALAPLVDAVYSDPTAYSAQAVWIAVLLFAIQIYCDFSGYTDMAIACARLLGYELTENFHFPFVARNIEDFWRRWHISLSTWFRDYVHIPTRERFPSERGALGSILATMSLVGLWHGAAWTFVIWGAAQGLAMAIHRSWRRARGPVRDPAPWAIALSIFATVYFTCASLIFFRAASFHDAWQLLRAFVGLTSDGSEQLDPRMWILILAMALMHWLGAREAFNRTLDRIPRWLFATGYGAATALALSFVPVEADPFIYFQF